MTKMNDKVVRVVFLVAVFSVLVLGRGAVWADTASVHEKLVSTLLELWESDPNAARQFINDLSYEELQAMGLDIESVDLEELKIGLKKTIDEYPDFRKNAKPETSVKAGSSFGNQALSGKKVSGQLQMLNVSPSPSSGVILIDAEQNGVADDNPGVLGLMMQDDAPADDFDEPVAGGPSFGVPDISAVESKSEKASVFEKEVVIEKEVAVAKEFAVEKEISAKVEERIREKSDSLAEKEQIVEKTEKVEEEKKPSEPVK